MSYKGDESQHSFKNWLSVDMLARNAVVAALYVVLTSISVYTSFGMVQFRISELLNLLVFFNPLYAIGLTLGCLLSNLVGFAYGVTVAWDILIGTSATLVACLLMIPFRQMFLASLMPCVVNGVVVGLEIYYLFPILTPSTGEAAADLTPLWVDMGWVFLGEFVVISVVGYILFFVLGKKYPPILKIIGATKNQNFVW